MPKTVTIVVVILISTLIIFNLTRQISEALKSGDRLDNGVDEVNKLQVKNSELKKKLTEAKSYDYIEEIARNKLNQSKSNETIVVIPEDLISKVLGLEKKVEEPKIPNWLGWLRLFLH